MCPQREDYSLGGPPLFGKCNCMNKNDRNGFASGVCTFLML